MVVNNFHFVCIPITPQKTDSPLIVDANAVSSPPIPHQTFQPITRRYAQLADVRGGVKQDQFPLGPTPDRKWQPTRPLPSKDPFRIAITETLDHALGMIARRANSVKHNGLERPALPD